MIDPCMSCGSDRNALPRDGCKQHASHINGYRAEVKRLRKTLWAITETTTDDVQRIKDVARGALAAHTAIDEDRA